MIFYGLFFTEELAMESIKPIPQLHNKWGIRSFLSELCGSFRKIRAVFSSKAQSESNSDAQKVSLAESALDRHGNAILRLAYSYLHNQSDAEDILQDTLLKYMQAAPAFEGEEHEKAWLLRVAANLSKNKIQYNKIREADELEETLVAEDREDLSFVWNVVKTLPPKYRGVIHLYYYEGYPTKEISAILKRKESSIRSDLKRGRERLKESLKEAYDFA